jgi:glycosyltransferase involved in cell wall biosynthesis
MVMKKIGTKKIEEDVRRENFLDYVKLHGFLSNPESIVIKADALVLPSLSEGISRAAMEALYLGIPCVLRDADGNQELVIDGVNGMVFADDLDLPDAMLRAAEISRQKRKRECLLPAGFRQRFAVNKYIELMDMSNG